MLSSLRLSTHTAMMCIQHFLLSPFAGDEAHFLVCESVGSRIGEGTVRADLSMEIHNQIPFSLL